MQPTDGESLEALRAAFESLLEAAEPALDATVTFAAVRGGAAGIGGLVGPDPEIAGEVFARRLDARARVGLRSADLPALEAATRGATDAVLGRPTGELRGLGFLRVGLDEVEPPVEPEGGGAERRLTFHLIFEHQRRPEAGDGGVILEIPLTADVAPPDGPIQ